MIGLGTLAGLGGMAVFFSEMLKEQAEEQVRSSLDGKVNAIASVTDTAETLAYGLGVSATTLHERRAQYADTYREIVLQLFERRPEFVVGLGLGQSKNGIIVDQPWMFPYYSVITAQEDTSFDQNTIVYEDLADDAGEFYPDTQRYQDYFLPQKSLWTEPYQAPNGRLLTYYLPMFGNDGDWLGTILVDINSQYLGQFLDDPVFRQTGHFLLMTQSGAIIADSANAEGDPLRSTYKDIAELEALWSQVTNLGEPGFLEGKTGYWAYAPVPGQDWMLLGYVPYTAVYCRIIRLTAVTTALLMGLVTTVLYLAVRKLNRRLKPILLQCDQLPQTNAEVWVDWNSQDELDQLSLAFFKLLEQLNGQESTIRHYQQALTKESRHIDQMLTQFLEFTTHMGEEANEQQLMIRQLQQRIANKDIRSVDLHLDALNTMGNALHSDLQRLPMSNSSALFAAVEQRIAAIFEVIEEMYADPRKTRLHILMTQLSADLKRLKSHDQQQQPSFKKLQYQTSNIAQAGKSALENSRGMAVLVQTSAETLVKIRAISNSLNRQVKVVSDMINVDLTQRKGAVVSDELTTVKK